MPAGRCNSRLATHSPAALLVLLLSACDTGGQPASGAALPAVSGVVDLVDIDGRNHGVPGSPAGGRWTSLFFVGTDCPVSNRYAPEIRRICSDYSAAGLQCLLVYSDRSLHRDAIGAHLAEYGYTLPAVHDATHRITALAGASITPEVAVFGAGAKLQYRGRIDDLFGELGRPRQQVTQRDLRAALDDLVAGRVVASPRTQAVGCYIEQ